MRIKILCLLSSLFFGTTVLAQNATLVKDITAGALSSFDEDGDKIIGHLGDKLLFVIHDATGISHLYSTEGTDASTIQIKATASADELFTEFVKVNDNTIAYVVTNQTSAKYNLYLTDGTTFNLLDKHIEDKEIRNIKSIPPYLYYISKNVIRRITVDNATDELLVSRGPNTMVDFHVDEFQENWLYYVVKALEAGQDDTLCFINPTIGIEVVLGQIGIGIDFDLKFRQIKDRRMVLFNKQSETSILLYATDATPEGTVLLSEYEFAADRFCFIYHDTLYFNKDSYTAGLGFTDATAEGTGLLFLWNPTSAIIYRDSLYFMSYSRADMFCGNFLFDKEGQLATAYQGGFDKTFYGSEEVNNLVVVNDKLYTSGNLKECYQYDEYGVEIIEIKTDNQLTAAEAYTMYETKPGADTYYRRNLCATDSKVFFIGEDAATGYELYVFEPNEKLVLATQNKVEARLFNCFPNPTSGELTLNYNGADEIMAVQLRDISGKIVRQFASVTQLSLQDLSQGLYFLEVELKNSKQVMKVVKK